MRLTPVGIVASLALLVLAGCAQASAPRASVSTVGVTPVASLAPATKPPLPSATVTGSSASPTVLVEDATATNPPDTATPVPSAPTVVPATVAGPSATTIPPTATALRPTATRVPATATPTPSGQLTADQIAATAVAESVGEQCVAAPPKPAKGFVGDPARGKVLYSQRGCVACHGAQAQGDVGPKLAGTTLSFEAVIHQLREPRGVMQRYLPQDQSDADECDVLIYVKGLK